MEYVQHGQYKKGKNMNTEGFGEDDQKRGEESIDQDVVEIMENNDLSEDEAKKVRDIMDEYGVDESAALDMLDDDMI